ncbi:MAG: hypothetical protein F4Y02_15805 [Chloroflexi bacterium]|nr:hypothetical protein [Chloroflexota bacterium]
MPARALQRARRAAPFSHAARLFFALRATGGRAVLTQVIKLRLTARDERRVRDGAAAAGMPASAYMRQLLRQRPVLPRIDRGLGTRAPDTDDDEPKRLTAFLRIRFTPADRAELGAHAEAAGMTVAGYVRRRALGHTVIAATDEMMIRELRRLGGLVKRVHSESGGAYSEQTAAALDDLRAAIQRVARRGRNFAPGDD